LNRAGGGQFEGTSRRTRSDVVRKVETEDVVDVLRQEHQDVLNHCNEFAFAALDEWDELFWSLMCRLKRHGAAMEFVVTPQLARLDGGVNLAEDLISDQLEIEELLERMATIDAVEPAFGELLRMVTARVRDQHRRENEVLVPLLWSSCSADERAAMGHRYKPIRRPPQQPLPPMLDDGRADDPADSREHLVGVAA
jgi:Hemerythrin HHE cation binding domain